ncbi:MAG: DAK2 domain-containing protein [Chloroflexi bacterium]|nr:MAG: DAK2 domain-containing protein [Chloroflexota bacterium]
MSVNAGVTKPLVDIGKPWQQCDGQQLKKLLRSSLAWLDANHEAIDALNVFPVPDGDSGTNMLLTFTAAWNEVAASPSSSVGEIMSGVAKGALMGARGNSGVILSQFLRGMANVMNNQQTVGAAGLARAFQEGTRLAYQGVQKPVEGTILTVARGGGEPGHPRAVDRNRRGRRAFGGSHAGDFSALEEGRGCGRRRARLVHHPARRVEVIERRTTRRRSRQDEQRARRKPASRKRLGL